MKKTFQRMSQTPDHYESFQKLKGTLTTLQKSFHYPEDEKLGPNHPGNKLVSIFYNQFKRTTWYLIKSVKLEMKADGGEDVSYKVDSKFHGLIHTTLDQPLPAIVCKQGYVARWTSNVGSNVMERGKFVFNDVELQTISYIKSDLYGQSISENERASWEKNLGNLKVLQEWGSALIPWNCSFRIPWFYSQSLSNYFPLYFCGFLDRIEHRLKLRRDVKSLLMVRRLSDKAIVEADRSTIESIDGKAPSEVAKMPAPAMYGQYVFLSDLECNNNRCSAETSGKFTSTLYIEDDIIAESSDTLRVGDGDETKTLKIELKSTKYPVHAFGWVAQNQTALKRGYYSNYTTNADDHTLGWDPVKSTTIEYDDFTLLDDEEGYRTNRVHPAHQYPTAPSQQGIHLWSMCAKANDSGMKPGIVYSKGAISLKLADTNPTLQLSSSAVPTKDLFKAVAVLTYTKKVIITHSNGKESDRQTSISTVKIE